MITSSDFESGLSFSLGFCLEVIPGRSNRDPCMQMHSVVCNVSMAIIQQVANQDAT
jgi:hypothetical protein